MRVFLGEFQGGLLSLLLFEITSLLDSWGLPREWGNAPHDYGPPKGFTENREIVFFKKEEGPEGCTSCNELAPSLGVL